MTFQKSIFLVLIFSSLHTFDFGQKRKDAIEWKSELKLKWSDFKGRPDRSNAAAVTNSGISFQYLYDGDSLVTITIISCFFIHSSWVKANAKNAEVLAHEQLHFDITELYARKLRQFIAEYKWANSTPFNKILDNQYEQFLNQLEDNQKLYDSETSHGINSMEQMRWSQLIEKELSETDSYSKTDLIIVLQ